MKEDEETSILNKFSKGLITAVPILAAVLAVGFLVSHKPAPAKEEQGAESIRAVRVIEVPSANLIPRAVGYGVAEPAMVWEAVAEVKGTILATHPHLKSGELIDSGMVLAQIDPIEYELAIARLESVVEETMANLKELDENEENTKQLVVIEQRSLRLAEKSFERKDSAAKRNALSQDDVDREERLYLQQKQNVQHLENLLDLMPSKRKALRAALDVHRANLRQAQIDLAKTVIKAPYDCRLGDVDIEAGQFVRAGQSLFKAHGTAATEVDARFRIEELRHLLSEKTRERFQTAFSTGGINRMFHDVRVMISIQDGDWSAEWEGRIDRFRESVDVKTREMNVVTIVDRPYDKAVPGIRPPLAAGMFCRVELQAPAREKNIIIPRSAIKGNSVFTVDTQNRLQEKQVIVDFYQTEFAVVKSGLSIGESLVVSNPTPAIIGMRVSPVEDVHLKQRLLKLGQKKRANQ